MIIVSSYKLFLFNEVITFPIASSRAETIAEMKSIDNFQHLLIVAYIVKNSPL